MKSRHSAGFSLLEVMVSAAILGVLALVFMQVGELGDRSVGDVTLRKAADTLARSAAVRLAQPGVCASSMTAATFNFAAAQTTDLVQQGSPVTFDLNGFGLSGGGVTVPGFPLQSQQSDFYSATGAGTTTAGEQIYHVRYGFVGQKQNAANAATTGAGDLRTRPVTDLYIAVSGGNTIAACEPSIDALTCADPTCICAQKVPRPMVYMPRHPASDGDGCVDPLARPDPIWEVTYGACSCGRTTTTGTATCRRADGTVEADTSLCGPSPFLPPTSIPQTVDCPPTSAAGCYQWDWGPWGACNSGTAYRNKVCFDRTVNPAVIVDDALCPGGAPPYPTYDVQSCGPAPSCYRYINYWYNFPPNHCSSLSPPLTRGYNVCSRRWDGVDPSCVDCPGQLARDPSWDMCITWDLDCCW